MANHSTEPSPSQSPGSSSNAPKYGTRVPNRIFVGGITSSTTESELHALFSNYGNVRATKIISDRAGVSKGYGFVTFETEEEASRIQEEADSIMLKERKLNIAPAIRKQQAFSSYSRTYESTTAATSNPILYHNGVPYTYNNGMAYFAAPDTASYPQYGAQQTAGYSMLYPTVYVQPQHALQQYQYHQLQASTAQHGWTANDWRWASNVGYGQNPSPVVTPQYVYAPSVAATGTTISNMGDQTSGPNNQLSVPNYQANPPQPSYNPNAAGGAGDHVDLQTIENNTADPNSRHQYASSEKNGKELEQRRADNVGYASNGGNNYQTTAPAILYTPMPIHTMSPSNVPMNTSTNGSRVAERRSGGNCGKRNEPQEKYPGAGTRNTRKVMPMGNDKNANGNVATAIVQQPPPNNVNYPAHTARTFPNAMHYAYQYQNPQVFQQYHYVPGYLQYPPPPPPPPCNTRFRGHNSIQSRHPAPRMYLGAGNGGNGNGGSNTPISSRNGQGGPLTPPNTPMSPGGIAASDPAIIGSMCTIQTMSLN